jgi:hypothetical protein
MIVLSDQDDIWMPHKLARYEQLFSSSPQTTAAFSNAEIVSECLQPLGWHLWAQTFKPAHQLRFQKGQAFEMLLQRDVVTGATMAFRAHCREWFLPVPSELGFLHDGWIALLIAALGQVTPIAEPLIQYRQHGKQQIGVNKDSSAQRATKAKKISRSQNRERHCRQLLRRLIGCRERLLQIFDRQDSRPLRELIHFRLSQIDEFERHVNRRLNWPRARKSRLAGIYREWKAGRFHTWSNGWSGVWDDLR